MEKAERNQKWRIKAVSKLIDMELVKIDEKIPLFLFLYEKVFSFLSLSIG